MDDLVVSCVLSALLWSAGDVLAQLVESSAFKSPLRTLRIAIFGGAIFAPITGAWFELLNQTFPDRTNDTTQHQHWMNVLVGAWPVAARVAADQLLYSPFILSLLFVTVGAMECGGADAVYTKWRSAIVPSLIRNWQVWPAVQTFNQSLVPPEYRLLLTNLVAIPWSAFLAYQAAQRQPTSKSAAAVPVRHIDAGVDDEARELIA